MSVGCDRPRAHVDFQYARGHGWDTVDLAIARKHATRPLAPPCANVGEERGRAVLGRDLQDELRRVWDGVDLVVGRQHTSIPFALLRTNVAKSIQGVRDWIDLKDLGGVVGLRELHTAHRIIE